MKKKKKENASSPYTYFEKSEETVFRTDETQKQEIYKQLKQKILKKRILNVISFVLAFTVLVSGFFVGQKGIEKFFFTFSKLSKFLQSLSVKNISTSS